MDVDDLERKHFMKTLAVFKYYRPYALKRVSEQTEIYEKLSERHKVLIPDFLIAMQNIKKCIENNAFFISQILRNAKPDIFEGDHFLSNQNDAIENFVQSGIINPQSDFAITSSDLDKVYSVLKQFVRDWSSVGAEERKQSYGPVLEEIKKLYWSSDRQLSDIRILVPGAGLGRLAWELANCGFSCQGNEWSLYMLLPAYFILNTCKKVGEYKLHPWATQFCNNMTRDNQTAAVTVPDVVPTDIPAGVQFSMVAGDFVEVYSEPESWDCVATVYFIDTAHNILDYLETIWRILVPGGYWINFGPLLYHFADIPGQDSIELSYEELKKAIKLVGFESVKEEVKIPSTFTQDPNSMLHYHYQCVLNVLRKPPSAKK
ncbi:Carnosine N-methyltransferase [Taenia solium]|eukprot:TsM_000264900 transcript=TsM_000264900 gene=TsM_000264900